MAFEPSLVERLYAPGSGMFWDVLRLWTPGEAACKKRSCGFHQRCVSQSSLQGAPPGSLRPCPTRRLTPPPATVAHVEVAEEQEPSRLTSPAEDLLQLPSFSCRLQGEEGRLVGPIPLSVEGRRFATIYGHAQRAEVVSDGASTRAVIHARGMMLGGEMSAAEIQVRPIEGLTHDGWLHARRLRVIEVGSDGTLRAGVSLPALLGAQAVRVSAPCSAVSLTGEVALPKDGESAHIARDVALSLRLSPKGPRFVTALVSRDPLVGEWSLVSGDPVVAEWSTVLVLERREPKVRIRIAGPDSWVEGWTESRALQQGEGLGLLGMLSGGLPSGTRFLSCPRELLVYVRPGAEPVRVGIVFPGAKVRVLSKEPLERLAGPGEVPLEVDDYPLRGLWAGETLQPFVRGDSLGGCELSS